MVSRWPVAAEAEAGSRPGTGSGTRDPGSRAGSSGAGPLSAAGPMCSGGQADEIAWIAFGSASGQDTVTIGFGSRSHQAPAGGCGVWAFTGIRADPGKRDEPALVSQPGAGISPVRIPCGECQIAATDTDRFCDRQQARTGSRFVTW